MSLLTLLRKKQVAQPEIIFNINFVDFSLTGNFDAFNLQRASVGTSINDNPNLVLNQENELRLTADVDGNSLGLLLEPTRTNLITYSAFDAVPPTDWNVGFGTGTFSYQVATWPFTGNFIGLEQRQETLGRSFLSQNVAVEAFKTYTASIYVDPAQSEVLDGSTTIFSVSGSDVTTKSRTIDDIDNQSRLTLQFTPFADSNVQIRVGVGAFGNAQGTLVWTAPQIEEGDNATSWIPTTDTPLTRAADIATLDLSVLGTTNPSVVLSSALREASGTLATYDNLNINTTGLDVNFSPYGTIQNGYTFTGFYGFTADPLIVAADGQTLSTNANLSTNGILTFGRDGSTTTNQTLRSVTVYEPGANENQLGQLTQ